MPFLTVTANQVQIYIIIVPDRKSVFLRFLHFYEVKHFSEASLTWLRYWRSQLLKIVYGLLKAANLNAIIWECNPFARCTISVVSSKIWMAGGINQVWVPRVGKTSWRLVVPAEIAENGPTNCARGIRHFSEFKITQKVSSIEIDVNRWAWQPVSILTCPLKKTCLHIDVNIFNVQIYVICYSHDKYVLKAFVWMIGEIWAMITLYWYWRWYSKIFLNFARKLAFHINKPFVWPVTRWQGHVRESLSSSKVDRSSYPNDYSC